MLPAVVFRGSKLLCREFSLVLEARGIEHEVQESGGHWVLTVPPRLVRAAERMTRIGTAVRLNASYRAVRRP